MACNDAGARHLFADEDKGRTCQEVATPQISHSAETSDE
jgi:hypothetical protein